eukprot:Transcript_8798.p2 GENE.Transcript_8798~~Transcript_8798.p2  ORF type:complete len:359 (+),score=14.89 Transcript_8798:26-1102(+)
MASLAAAMLSAGAHAVGWIEKAEPQQAEPWIITPADKPRQHVSVKEAEKQILRGTTPPRALALDQAEPDSDQELPARQQPSRTQELRRQGPKAMGGAGGSRQRSGGQPFRPRMAPLAATLHPSGQLAAKHRPGADVYPDRRGGSRPGARLGLRTGGQKAGKLKPRGAYLGSHTGSRPGGQPGGRGRAVGQTSDLSNSRPDVQKLAGLSNQHAQLAANPGHPVAPSFGDSVGTGSLPPSWGTSIQPLQDHSDAESQPLHENPSPLMQAEQEIADMFGGISDKKAHTEPGAALQPAPLPSSTTALPMQERLATPHNMPDGIPFRPVDRPPSGKGPGASASCAASGGCHGGRAAGSFGNDG